MTDVVAEKSQDFTLLKFACCFFVVIVLPLAILPAAMHDYNLKGQMQEALEPMRVVEYDTLGTNTAIDENLVKGMALNKYLAHIDMKEKEQIDFTFNKNSYDELQNAKISFFPVRKANGVIYKWFCSVTGDQEKIKSIKYNCRLN